MNQVVAALGHFRVAKYEVSIEPKETLLLPRYKGSTFRGGFGGVFRRIACSHGERACATCLLRDACAYAIVFESFPPRDSQKLRKYEAVPRPFVIEPPLTEQTRFEPGESLRVGLVLVGRAISLLPYFVVVLRELGGVGLGKGRGRYELAAIDAAEPWGGSRAPVYRATDGLVRAADLVLAAETLGRWGEAMAESVQGAGGLAVEFLTMTRLKHGGRLTGSVEFHVLIRNVLRRLSSLSYFHHGVPLELDFRGLIARAQGVAVVESRVQWLDWERYSSRQDTKMFLGGVVGRVRYAGEVEPFLPLLALGELVHVGKGATFGLGQIRVGPWRSGEGGHGGEGFL